MIDELFGHNTYDNMLSFQIDNETGDYEIYFNTTNLSKEYVDNLSAFLISLGSGAIHPNIYDTIASWGQNNKEKIKFCRALGTNIEKLYKLASKEESKGKPYIRASRVFHLKQIME